MSARRLNVMISSRNTAPVDLDGKRVKLSTVRIRLKKELENLDPFGTGKQLFEVWINEAMPPKAGDKTTWEHSLDLVDRADIVLCIYNGDPGWSDRQPIGICHAELEQALSHQRLKAYAVTLPLVPLPKAAKARDRFALFRDYWDSQKLWTNPAKNGREVIDAARLAIHEALCVLVAHGRKAKMGSFDLGDALTWSRFNFEQRKEAIESEIVTALRLSYDAKVIREGAVALELGTTQLLLRVHAIPGATSTAAAREMVGRPFHHDHKWTPDLKPKGRGGPIHIVGCHRTVTEQQAVSLLGRPDITTVVTSFGILAIDQVSKVQCLLLKDCRDGASTRHAVGLAFDWLIRSDESRFVVERALARAEIVTVMARELPRGQPSP